MMIKPNAIIAPAVTIVVQIIKRAWPSKFDELSRLVPLFAALFGGMTNVIYRFGFDTIAPQNVAQSIWFGLLFAVEGVIMGASSVGIYEIGKDRVFKRTEEYLEE